MGKENSDSKVAVNAPVFRRKDRKRFRIAVRGDCCCRRAINMNASMCPDGVQVFVNEKTPNRCFVDTIENRGPDQSYGESLSDIESMSRSLSTYYKDQFSRSVLNETDIDLIVMDNYSDMNFQLWRHGQENWHMWIHPKFVDREKLENNFVNVGYASFDDAVKDACAVIDAIRENNKDVPVLFLNQPIEYYKNLDKRLEFYNMGAEVEKRMDNVYAAAPLAFDDLIPDDMGSCGPGQTLHFSGETYMKMIAEAWEKGLSSHFCENSHEKTMQPVFKPEGVPAEIQMTSEFKENASPDFDFVPPADLREIDISGIPNDKISYGERRSLCLSTCPKSVDTAVKSFQQYITHPETDEEFNPKRFTPMLIPIAAASEFEEWEATLRQFGKGSKLRQKRKALKSGFYCKPFAWKLHIPDVHEINYSKTERSGGAMRGSYLRTVDEMGGAPDKKYEVIYPKCMNHWNMTFGTFMPVDGYTQGDFTTDEKLVAYISLRRIGDVILYSQILGHGDHLSSGVQILLHHEVIKWLSENTATYSKELKYVMYGGAQNGGAPLYSWKRQSGFKPCLLQAYRSDKGMMEAVK